MPEALSKSEFLSLMRGYLARDIADAQSYDCILGMKVWARTDLKWAAEPCPRGARFVGVYLPHEVPQLYPDDCPEKDACCCLLREHVFADDKTPEAEALRAKMIACGRIPPEPRAELPPMTPEEELQLLSMVRHAIETLPEEKVGLWKKIGRLFQKN